MFFLENVENLIEHDQGRTFQTIYTSLAERGYIIHYRTMPLMSTPIFHKQDVGFI